MKVRQWLVKFVCLNRIKDVIKRLNYVVCDACWLQNNQIKNKQGELIDSVYNAEVITGMNVPQIGILCWFEFEGFILDNITAAMGKKQVGPGYWRMECCKQGFYSAMAPMKRTKRRTA